VSEHDNRQFSLLLVEDSPADVFLVKQAMREQGLNAKIQIAGDGDSAMNIINHMDDEGGSPCPDIVLLDLNIPKRSGDEVLERFRRSPKTANVPVVVMTSSESPVDRARALELGATEFFQKPSSLAEFMKLGRLVRSIHEHARRTAA
jgi:chemotaxis family two-component system response regulator Rcp1